MKPLVLFTFQLKELLGSRRPRVWLRPKGSR